MNIEESIIEFKKMIERDKDTLRYWKSDTFGHYDESIKKLEKDVLISETLLTAYEKEKEKNKKIENELKDITKKYMEAESVKFWYNYIHKDKIRKMLQELEDRRNKQPVIGYWSKKAMLEKLLKEE